MRRYAILFDHENGLYLNDSVVGDDTTRIGGGHVLLWNFISGSQLPSTNNAGEAAHNAAMPNFA
jgi:hypothetical protein